MQEVIPLRERSKAKRRAAIQGAALRLFAEHGYDNTTVADIADAAEVATRTVSTHFPNKLDIATSAADDLAARLTATFEENPELAFTDVVEVWLIAEFDSGNSELAKLTAEMFDANPGMRAASTIQMIAVKDLARSALLAESGLSSDDPMLPMVGAAVGAVLMEYFSMSALRKTLSESEARKSCVDYLRSIIAPRS